jgi:hypothetical protein
MDWTCSTHEDVEKYLRAFLVARSEGRCHFRDLELDGRELSNES